MSKKHKRQKQRDTFPLPLIIFGGILLIVAAFFLARQSGGDDGGIPSITVDPKIIEYGDVKFNTPETFTVKVTNTGDGTLRFKEQPYIEVLEGC